MALPLDWTEKIFEKLSLRYGVAFLRQWEGMDIGAVKNDWCLMLGAYHAHPECLGWAMKNLPVDCLKNVEQFAALCKSAPRKDAPRIDAPSVDPEKMREAMAELNMINKKKNDKRLGWAYKIINNPKNYPAYSLELAKQALVKKGIESQPITEE
jgi:hypothetical protein